MRTYFASGLTGHSLYVVDGQFPVDPWAEVAGDTDGDGDCDQRDLETVLANLGLTGQPGELSPFDGDLNGDGVVDGIDLGVVQANLGASASAAFTPQCPGGPGSCCQGLPVGFVCRVPCDGGDAVGLAGNTLFRCDDFSCDQWCGVGIDGPTTIDINWP
jgi:hypothetical protein